MTPTYDKLMTYIYLFAESTLDGPRDLHPVHQVQCKGRCI